MVSLICVCWGAGIRLGSLIATSIPISKGMSSVCSFGTGAPAQQRLESDAGRESQATMAQAQYQASKLAMRSKQPNHLWLGLIFFIALCFVAAGIGGAVTTPNIEGWYATLAKPSWNPPNWIFGPVWTALYLMMALAAWLVWRQGGWNATRVPLILFGIQLALNTLWSCLFFGLKNPGLAFAEVLLLWLAIALTMIAFWNRSKIAGLLFGPYLAWVTFAAVLNFTIWRLNF